MTQATVDKATMKARLAALVDAGLPAPRWIDPQQNVVQAHHLHLHCRTLADLVAWAEALDLTPHTALSGRVGDDDPEAWLWVTAGGDLWGWKFYLHCDDPAGHADTAGWWDRVAALRRGWETGPPDTTTVEGTS